MLPRGWNAYFVYALSLAAAAALFSLALRVYPPSAFAVLALMGAGGIWLHRKATVFLEDAQVFSLKQKRLDAKAWYFESVITNSGNIIFTTDAERDYAAGLTQQKRAKLRELAPLWEMHPEGIDLNTGQWAAH